MYLEPKYRELTQGSIFSCAYAENYPKTMVYGIVITARCDVANQKTPTYHYIPAVSLDAWLMNDGAELIIERAEHEQMNAIENLFLQNNISHSLLKTKSIEEIITITIEKKLAAGELKPKTANGLTNALQELQSIRGLRESASPIEELKRSKRAMQKATDLLNELRRHQLAGFHYLPKLPDLSEIGKGNYVALLREIYHIPKHVAIKIPDGLDQTGLAALRPSERCLRFNESSDYCIVTTKIESPWIEHILQRWSSIFTRIGVPDIPAHAMPTTFSAGGDEQ
jgi:hypothetical protein